MRHFLFSYCSIVGVYVELSVTHAVFFSLFPSSVFPRRWCCQPELLSDGFRRAAGPTPPWLPSHNEGLPMDGDTTPTQKAVALVNTGCKQTNKTNEERNESTIWERTCPEPKINSEWRNVIPFFFFPVFHFGTIWVLLRNLALYWMLWNYLPPNGKRTIIFICVFSGFVCPCVEKCRNFV